MDAKKLGQFIAEMRKEKEMTQAELASKLHVTDKAISKWERGLGLPDINSIEPLADALGISVAEVMQAERIPDDHVTQENASEMLTNAFDIMKQQRKLERKHHTLILIGVLLAIALLFLGDTMGWMRMFFFVVAPCLCVALAISLVIYGIWRKRNHLPCARTFIFAAVLILFPIALIAFFFLAGILGLGPVPS